LARIILHDTHSIRPGQTATAQLELKEPILAFVGDRLLLRDGSEQHTIAGGIVLDVDREDARSAKDRAILASRAAAPADVDLAVWTEIALGKFLQPARLLEHSRFSAIEITAALQRLAKNGEIFLSENVAAKMRLWRELRDQAETFIDAVHKKQPERRGIELTELHAQLNSISIPVFETLVADLTRAGFIRVGSTVARPSHRATLPAELRAPAEQIRAAVTVKPFDPPGRRDLAKDRSRQQALRFLIQQGDLVEISEEIVLDRDAFHQMQAIVANFISTNGPATTSQLREKIGSSRRVMIPFLEYLDRTGITQRAGDLRSLRPPKSTAIAPS
jgi:selenocysteine-specific elongation factor